MQYDCSLEELDSMTMHVGLVGEDGIVIAGDRQITEHVGEDGPSASYQSKKIEICGNFVCCWAGALPAEWTIKKLKAKDCPLANLPMSERGAWLEACGEATLESISKDPTRKDIGYGINTLFVAFNDGMLLMLTIRNPSISTPIYDKMVIGPRETLLDF